MKISKLTSYIANRFGQISDNILNRIKNISASKSGTNEQELNSKNDKLVGVVIL